MKQCNFRSLFYSACLTVTLLVAGPMLHAQEAMYDGAFWRIGLYAGANYNIVDQNLAQFVQVPEDPALAGRDLSGGTGFGPYSGALLEYNSGDLLGFQARLGFDLRAVTATEGETELSPILSYFLVEPALRVNLGTPDFHLLVGPALLLNLVHTYDYVSSPNISVSDRDLQNTSGAVFGAWGGLGYDIRINEGKDDWVWYVTPFVEGSYLLDQKEPDIAGVDDTWNTLTLRGGLQLKFGQGPEPSMIAVSERPTLNFTVRTPPDGVVEQRKLMEHFPLLNYIFFPEGSTDIPTRYARLDPAVAESFDEAQLLERPAAGVGGGERFSTRTTRQMDVYYNALNIFGDRLRDNPGTKVTLVGSAPKREEGRAMAESIKEYLTGTFGIDPSRIEVKGETRPPHASGTRATPKADQGLVAEENRRVEILTDDMALLSPVELRTEQEILLDNDVVFFVRSDDPVNTWEVEVQGEGVTRTYGPFSQPVERIDARSLLGDAAAGTYTARLRVNLKDGRTVMRETTFHLNRKEGEPVTASRYSILFEYDESKSVETYADFLRRVVLPEIPAEGAVFIHGHTDKIGEDDYNLKLSAKRALDAEEILEQALRRMNRETVFDAYGFGETEFRAPFSNETPEGRYYNRTVMIEIIPGS